MEKGPDAFRTISEVADDLDLPQHVLRFWESRFPQIHPLKRGGGRRYYRPDDVELLRGIRHLLYGEGYTIRGVQRILKEEGPRYVQAIWRDAEADALASSQHDAPEWVDAGHPGRAGKTEQEPAQRGGALSGFFNLLPSRQRDLADEPVAKRSAKRRGPEVEQEYMELPLLPDLAPQSRPVRPEPARAEPPHIEPVLRPVEARTSFPFRGVSPEVLPEDDYEPRYEPEPTPVPPRPMPVPPAAARPEPVQPRPMPMRPVEDAPVRAADPRANLTRDDVQRLQAALYELQECLGILDAAREQD